VEEVQRIAKVGSKRTPSYPAYCSEAQGRKRRIRKAPLPPDEGTMAKP